MSVKFERESIRQNVAEAVTGSKGPLPGTSGDNPIAAAIGTAITGGKKNAGTKGYLAVCGFTHRSSTLHLVPCYEGSVYFVHINASLCLEDG
jgi:hypothetical protein